MAICCFKEALKVLVSLTSFEVDMTFKRVKDTNINEVVFAAFLPGLNKSNIFLIYSKCITNTLIVMTFVRVFVDQDSTHMYTRLFKQVFQLVEQQLGESVKWRHLHGTGFGCMVMDMDSKQLSGKLILLILLVHC
jgi:hypothetical protein